MTTSEVELVDVVGGELGRRAEDDLAVLADRVVAELAGGELVALLAGDLTGGQRGAGVGGQVTDVGRVPQGELLDGAVLDVLPHLVRQAEAGDGDLALVRGRADVAGRRRDAD